MMYQRKLILLLVFTITDCSFEQKSSNHINQNFRLPKIIQKQSKDTVEILDFDYLTFSWLLFEGKHKFTDTLRLGPSAEKKITDSNDIIYDFQNPKIEDTLATDGFQIFTDYQTTIFHRDDNLLKSFQFFPAYIVNETPRTKLFIAKDKKVFGIQEAIDTTNYSRWLPIEMKSMDYCGVGYYGLKVHPGEFIMVLAPKYMGDQKGRIRLRLQIGTSIYISPAYIGAFNQKQFDLKKELSPREF